MTQCALPGCSKDAYARGWCQRHYRRWCRHGQANAVVRELGHPEQTYYGRRIVHWKPEFWAKWWSERLEHPHAAHLAGGIADMRKRLAQKEPGR